MSNPVLDRLREERAKHVEYISTLLSKVDEDQRDLVDAEKSSLASVRERITAIDGQIEPLEAFEQTRAAHQETVTAITPTARAGEQRPGSTRLGVRQRDQRYATAGDFLADVVRSQQHWSTDGVEQRADDAARDRVASARETAQRDAQEKGYSQRAAGDVAPGVHQTTADVPGLLPVTIQGQIEDKLDGSRPLIQSIGAKDLAEIPGLTFNRPHITQHTGTAEQAAEKAELASRELKIGSIPFTKETAGGWLNISRQTIDFTSPAAWNIILEDLQLAYAEDTDDTAALAFSAGVTQTETVDTENAGKVDAWVDALYGAAYKAATASGTKRASARRLPDVIYTSIDMWRDLGSMLTKAAIADQSARSAGQAEPTGFAGSLLDVPRIMVPGLASGTVVVGRRDRFEYYEQRIGLLSALVPKVFGMEIAYGGYYAFGFLDATAFAKIKVG